MRVQGLYLMPVVVTERKYMLTVLRACIVAYTRVTRVVHSVYKHFTRSGNEIACYITRNHSSINH